MVTQKIPNNQAILRKNKAGGIILLNFKLSYKAIVVKTAWYLFKNTYRPIDQSWEPRNKPSPTFSTDIWQGAKNTQWKKNSLFNKCCCKN